jgi:hypothetical protein
VQVPLEEDGVRIELGKYKADPFVAGTFPPHYLYALQTLQSDEEGAYGAAFVSLRSAENGSANAKWRLGQLNATSLLALHR